MPRQTKPVPEVLREFVAYLWARTRAGHPDPLSASAAAAYQSALVRMHANGGLESQKAAEDYVCGLGMSGHAESAKQANTAHRAWSRWYHAQPAASESAPPSTTAAPEPPVVVRPEVRAFTPLVPPPALPPVPAAIRRKSEPSPIVRRMIAEMRVARLGSERTLTSTPWSCVTDAAAEGIPGAGPGLCLRLGNQRLFIPCASQEEVEQVIQDAGSRPHTFIIEETP